MSDHLNKIRSWRLKGMTYAAIQAKCEKRGYTTQINTTPTIKTIHLWCKGVVPRGGTPLTTQRILKARPKRRRLDQLPQNDGLADLILNLRAQGLTLRAITERVTHDGYLTSKGTPIGKTQIIRILQRSYGGSSTRAKT